MYDPLTSLLIGMLLLAILIILFFPGKGLYFYWRRARATGERVFLEDALKHAYDCELRRISCTLDSIAGNAGISRDKAFDAVEKLEKMSLVKQSNNLIELTSEGRTYALKVIRVHRIWEKYLADETGVSEVDWHKSAEEVEHTLSEEEANDLAAQIGNPLIDPHGDPIPDEKGEMPKTDDSTLDDLGEGEFGIITHIEDEPESAYSQIIVLGLHRGTQVRLLSRSGSKVFFEADGEECVLSPMLVSNINIRKAGEKEVRTNFRSLLDLKKGETAQVAGIAASCRGMQRRRLLDMGIVPGTEVSISVGSPSGNPVAYNVRDTFIALRNDQASLIYITENAEENLSSGTAEESEKL